ncbi:serpin B6-like [Vombatus ursinus]|uniref:serpin B6-like n=1 Tax=Vombatus ursinus TaxID=29139 RepID=UPI000FFCFF0A|nr:serpin B6-like [Vombatus ursinus]
MDSLTEANNMLAITLLKKLCKEKTENVLFSPPSLSFALATILLGAKNDTAAQIEHLFSLDRDGDINLGFQSLLTEMNKPVTSYLLGTTNRLFGENALNFLPFFKESCEKLYNSVLEDVCFSEEAEAVRKHINAWVAENTEGVGGREAREASSIVCLTSTPEGKQIWEVIFWLHSGRSVNPRGYTGSLIVGFSIFFFQMEEGLTYETFITWTKPEAADLMEILRKQLFLPRIKIEESYDMVHILCSLGISDAFHEDKADFSGLSTLKDLHLLSVFHSSFLEFTEEGIKASAATVAVEIPGNAKGKEGLKSPSLFFFLIWSHKIKSILFCGRVCIP